jgi:hypothetical protein
MSKMPPREAARGGGRGGGASPYTADAGRDKLRNNSRARAASATQRCALFCAPAFCALPFDPPHVR